VTIATLRRILTTHRDDYLSMITSKGIAAAVVGLASLSLVGVALANEAEGPDLADQIEVAAGSCDTTTTTVDEGTVDEGTVDEGTVDEGTVEDSDCDEADAVEEADDEAVEVETDAVDDDAAEPEADAVEADHPLNHGFYVSEATKTCPESGRERGQCISAVAKSDIGKAGADSTTEDTAVEGAESEDTAGSEGTVEETPKPSKPTTAGQGHASGKSKGKH
jgi:hypothetical protein